MKKDHLDALLRINDEQVAAVTKRWKDENLVEIIDFPAEDFLKATLENDKVQAVRASWKERAMAAGMPEADADAVVAEITN